MIFKSFFILNFFICFFKIFLQQIKIKGLFKLLFFIDLKKISKKMLLGSPAINKIGFGLVVYNIAISESK